MAAVDRRRLRRTDFFFDRLRVIFCILSRDFWSSKQKVDSTKVLVQGFFFTFTEIVGFFVCSLVASIEIIRLFCELSSRLFPSLICAIRLHPWQSRVGDAERCARRTEGRSVLVQAVRLQDAEDKSEYVAAAKALDEALAELHGGGEQG